MWYRQCERSVEHEGQAKSHVGTGDCLRERKQPWRRGEMRQGRRPEVRRLHIARAFESQ